VAVCQFIPSGVRACACARARARVCVCARARACVCVGGGTYLVETMSWNVLEVMWKFRSS
jgi:hypothetical protein